MSVSPVNCAEPWAWAAIPPMTTKSTPADDSSANSRSGRWSSGGIACSPGGCREVAEPSEPIGHRLEALRRRQREVLDEQRLVVAGLLLDRLQDQPATHGIQRAPHRLDRDVVSCRLH